MEKNEIKSFTVIIPLDVYLNNNPISTTTIKIGDMSIDTFSKRLIDVKTSKVIVGFINNLSYSINVLLNDKGSFQTKKIEEVSIRDTVVLKEQIKDLKYIEQTELFKEDEQGKD